MWVGGIGLYPCDPSSPVILSPEVAPGHTYHFGQLKYLAAPYRVIVCGLGPRLSCLASGSLTIA